MRGEYKLTNLHSKAGTFKAIDNQGMAVKEKYTLIEPGNVRFEIFRQGSPPEIVTGTYSLQGDVLTFTSADGKEIDFFDSLARYSKLFKYQFFYLFGHKKAIAIIKLKAKE